MRLARGGRQIAVADSSSSPVRKRTAVIKIKQMHVEHSRQLNEENRKEKRLKSGNLN